MKKTILLIFLLVPLFCLAQETVKLKGKITSENMPLQWATVSISNLDGKIINGTTSQQDGSFELNLKSDSYKIEITFTFDNSLIF